MNILFPAPPAKDEEQSGRFRVNPAEEDWKVEKPWLTVQGLSSQGTW